MYFKKYFGAFHLNFFPGEFICLGSGQYFLDSQSVSQPAVISQPTSHLTKCQPDLIPHLTKHQLDLIQSLILEGYI